ncbi:hypothetical protein OROMI_004436 [Orobanche minor]
MLNKMKEEGIHLDLTTYTVLMDGYARAGLLGRAFGIFRSMVDAGWLCREVRLEVALKLVDHMTERGLSPSEDTYNSLVDCCCKLRMFVEAVRSLDTMVALVDRCHHTLGCKEPLRCLLLRNNGDLSLLDLDDGRERELTDSIELFWVTYGRSEEKANLIEEVSWLDYGHRGMQVWYSSSGVEPFKQEDFVQLDPELEFDREVYPLGLLPNAGIVVGVTQRMSFSACTEFPCFEPSPQAQTILHCLLRHLLQRNKSEEALQLAQLSAEKPHFSHCLEWLLFTVFEAEISSWMPHNQNASRNQTSVSLLEKTCDLIRNFPEYFDVVVSVARKTDGRHWADLFSAAGRSTEGCLRNVFSGDGTCSLLYTTY